MKKRPKKILITTSRNPSEQSRRFGKSLHRILRHSLFVNRGNMNEAMLHHYAIEQGCDHLYMVYSQTTNVDRLVINRVRETHFEQVKVFLKIYQYLDHKMFGFDRIPESGPISTSIAARQINRELVDFFEDYLDLTLGEKHPIWMVLDQPSHKSSTYIALIDALTQKRILFAEVQLREMKV